MRQHDELRQDLFDMGENFAPGAHGIVLATALVVAAEELNIPRDEFIAETRPRLESLQPMFEDRTLLRPPPAQDVERYKRLVMQRVRRFSTTSSITLVNVFFASLTDVVMKRGLPSDLVVGMLISLWDGTPLVTVGPELPAEGDLNG